MTVPAERDRLYRQRARTGLVAPAGTTTPTQIGQIELAMFINKTGLQAIGDNLYLETPPSSGTPQNGHAQHPSASAI